jgi:choline dehydrogenase-like flavoprotein
MVGDIPDATLADWPISYEELEPWYSRAEWEIGVSGARGPTIPRIDQSPYPAAADAGEILRRAVRKGRQGPWPHAAGSAGRDPLQALSRAPRLHQLRLVHRLRLRGQCQVVDAGNDDSRGAGQRQLRAAPPVDGQPYRGRRPGPRPRRGLLRCRGQGADAAARSVVLAANGAETPRLLLMSATDRHPDGLANSSGMVGRNLMFNAHSVAYGKFEHPLNEYKSIQCTRIALDYYDSDEKRGFFGGGAFDARGYLNGYPLLYALQGVPQDDGRAGGRTTRRCSRSTTCATWP